MHRVRPPAALDEAGIERAIERLRQTVRRRGLKSSSVREAIARAALARQGHFSIDDLVRNVRVGGVSEARAATVYRSSRLPTAWDGRSCPATTSRAAWPRPAPRATGAPSPP